MRVSLANGDRFELAKYDTKTVEYNGDRTPAIILYLNDSNINAVKSAFGSEANLATISVHTDTGERIDFQGYQVRKSIGFGASDDQLEVTLVRGTDVSQKVVALTADVKTMTATFEQALTLFAEMKTATEEYIKVAAAAANSTSEAIKKATQAEEYAATLADAVTQREGVIESFGSSAQAAAEAMTKVSREIEVVRTEYATMREAFVDATSKVTKIAADADKMTTDFNARITEMDAILTEARAIRESVDDTNTKVTTSNDNVTKFTQVVTEHGKNIEKFETTINTSVDEFKTTVTEGVEGFKTDVNKNFQTMEENVNKNIQTMETDVKQSKETAAEAKQTADGLESRIVALEPVTDITKMMLPEAKRFKIKESRQALADYLETHPVSYVHNGYMQQFSCTSEKQSYLQAMILTSTMAAQAGVPYQPSWNAVGEPCSYDWTIADLQGLAMVIEAAVRPRVSIQQDYEKNINAVASVEALMGMIFNYDDITGHVPPTPAAPPVLPNTSTTTDDLPAAPEVTIADRV